MKLINALPFICGDLRTQIARGGLGELPARVARPARRGIRRRPRDAIPGARARCTNGSICNYRAAVRTPAQRLWRVVSMVRYRFFLYAGLLPYLLGAAWAWAIAGTFDAPVFWSGLSGVVLAVIGVEAFNEYFDARMGTDRVFNPADLPPISDGVFWCGVVAFAAALAVGLYLALHVGWPIVVFAILGGMAAIFYEAPPIRWCYRGLGETVIALSYGPWMVLGSLYLHTQSAVVGRLRGVARAGTAHHVARGRQRDPRLPPGSARRQAQPRRAPRPRAAASCCISRSPRRGLAVAIVGVARRRVSHAALQRRSRFRCSSRARCAARGTYTTPRAFVPAIRAIVACYAAGVLLFTLGIVVQRLVPVTLRIDTFGAPIFVSWQLTRDCDLACLHCCTESAPGKRLRRRARRGRSDARRGRDRRGARALRHAVRRRADDRPALLGHRRNPRAAPASTSRSRPTASVSTPRWRAVSRRCRSARSRSASTATRRKSTSGSAPAASLARAHAACRAVREAGLPLEVTFAPTRINIHEAGAVIARARELGAFRFNSGQLMRLGTAARLWHKLEPTPAQYDAFRETLAAHAADH